MAIKHIVNNFNSIAENASKYLDGDVVVTKGFYHPNDGGGALYNIIATIPSKVSGVMQGLSLLGSSLDPDGLTLIDLGNSLYAELILDASLMLNIKLIGGKSIETCVKYGESLFDNNFAVSIYKNYYKRRELVACLYIPQGHWCFSETIILNGIQGMGIKGCGNSTTLLPFADGQKYIIRFGNDSHLSSDNASGYLQPGGYFMDNFRISTSVEECNSAIKTLYGSKKSTSIAPIYFRNVRSSKFSNIFFENILDTALAITQVAETGWHNFRFHKCGKLGGLVITILPDASKGMNIGSSVSANWFKHLFFDSCLGNYIRSTYDLNFVHNEFGTIIISGSVDEYQNTSVTKPDSATTSDIVYEGLIRGGSGSGWNHVIFNIIQICELKNYGVSSDGTSYIYNSLVEGVNDTISKKFWFNIITLPEELTWILYYNKSTTFSTSDTVCINTPLKDMKKSFYVSGTTIEVTPYPYYQRDIYYPACLSYRRSFGLGRTVAPYWFSPIGIWSYTGNESCIFEVLQGKTYIYRYYTTAGTVTIDSSTITTTTLTDGSGGNWKYAKFKVPEDTSNPVKTVTITKSNIDFVACIN